VLLRQPRAYFWYNRSGMLKKTPCKEPF